MPKFPRFHGVIIMSAKPQRTKKASNQHKTTQPKSAHAVDNSAAQPEDLHEKDESCQDVPEAAQKDRDVLPDRTGGQNRTIDQKRNDEQQYHAAGVAHDPHNRTQELVDRGDPAAGDLDEETLSPTAPFNKTYGHRK
jgi:hypothetical protein